MLPRLIPLVILAAACSQLEQGFNPEAVPAIVGPEPIQGHYRGTFSHLPGVRNRNVHGSFGLYLATDAPGGAPLSTAQLIGAPLHCAYDWIETHTSATSPGYLCTAAELAAGECRWRARFMTYANHSTQPACDDVDDPGEPGEYQQWHTFAFILEALLAEDVARVIERHGDLLVQEQVAFADAIAAFEEGELVDGEWIIARLVPLGDASVICERSGVPARFQVDEEGRPNPPFGLPFDLRDEGHPAGTCDPDRHGVTFWIGEVER